MPWNCWEVTLLRRLTLRNWRLSKIITSKVSRNCNISSKNSKLSGHSNSLTDRTYALILSFFAIFLFLVRVVRGAIIGRCIFTFVLPSLHIFLLLSLRLWWSLLSWFSVSLFNNFRVVEVALFTSLAGLLVSPSSPSIVG